MRLLCRLALGLALTANFAPFLWRDALVANAETRSEPAARLVEIFDAAGIPIDAFGWADVRDDGDNLVVKDFYMSVAGEDRDTGIKNIPLGDVQLSNIRIEDSRLLSIKIEATGLVIDLAAFAKSVRSLGNTGDLDASDAMDLAMLADYLRGSGYNEMRPSFRYEVANDILTGVSTDAFELDIPKAFGLSFGTVTKGVTAAYLDWYKSNVIKVYLAGTPDVEGDINKEVQATDGPFIGVGFSEVSFAFDDKGFMSKLEPYLVMLRADLIGNEPDGTPRAGLSEEELSEMAHNMGRGILTSETLLPLVTALHNFLLRPDVIRIHAKFEPALTLRESGLYSDKGFPEVSDLKGRLTIDASN